MIDLATYTDLRDRLAAAGYASEYEWSQSVQPPDTEDAFFNEYAWVVVNSGMKNTVAEMIWARIRGALAAGRPISSAFGHPAKAAALQQVYDQRLTYFLAFNEVNLRCDPAEVVAFCQTLPWIGPITKWHLAKNLGIDCAKPDRWLERLARADQTTPHELCARLAAASGDRIATVDLLLWRAATLGWLGEELEAIA